MMRTGAGSAPARSTMARSLDEAMSKLPVIEASPDGMRSRMLGAELTTPSSTIASWRPTLLPVMRAKSARPLGVSFMLTPHAPGLVCSRPTRASAAATEPPLISDSRFTT